jgi:hypothetical protein
MPGHKRKTHKSCPNYNKNKAKRKHTFGTDDAFGDIDEGENSTEAEASRRRLSILGKHEAKISIIFLKFMSPALLLTYMFVYFIHLCNQTFALIDLRANYKRNPVIIYFRTEDTEFSEGSSTSDIRQSVEILDALDFSDDQEKPIGELIIEDE